MKITPKKGYVLVSDQEIIQEKKVGILIIPDEDKKRTYLRLESDGENYKIGQCVFAQPYKNKMQIEDNLFLIAEEDILASFILD